MDVPMDIRAACLATPRLLLRGWREDDLADFHEYARVEGVGEMAGWLPHTSLEETRRILERFIQKGNVFALADRASGKVIGSLGLHRSWAAEEPAYAALRVKEIGYALSKEYWGRGLMTEAVRAALRFCFEECGLDAVTAAHYAENTRSRRVIEKGGFAFVRQVELYIEPLQRTVQERQYIRFANPPGGNGLCIPESGPTA